MEEVIAQLLEKITSIENESIELKKLLAKQARNDELADTFYDESKGAFNYSAKKRLKRYNPEILEILEAIEDLNKLNIFLCKGGYSVTSAEEVRNALSKAGVGILKIDQLITDYRYCQDLVKIINDPDFKDPDMRKVFEDTIKSIVREIDKCCDDRIEQAREMIRNGGKDKPKFDSDKVNSEIANLEMEKRKIERYIPILRSESIYFETEEELNDFYEWMKLNIPIDEQFEIILNISKTKISKSLDDSIGVDEIDENRKELEEQLTEIHTDILDKILEHIDDFGDDKDLIKKFIENYKDLSSRITDRASLLDKSSTLEDRKTVYLMNGTYNWESVLSDLEENILPDLESKLHKKDKKTFDTIKYVTEVYDKEDKDRSIRRENINKIRVYIDSLKKLMKYAERYDASSYEYVIEQGIQVGEEGYPKNVPYEQIDMSYFLNHSTKEVIDKLYGVLYKLRENEKQRLALDENGKETQIDFEKIDKVYDDILTTSQTKINKFNMVREALGEYTEIEEDGVDFDPSENLVFYLDLDAEPVDEISKKEVLETLKEHEEKKSWVMKKNVSSELKNHNKNAKNKTHITVLSTPDYDAYRHRGTPTGRTGIIKFKLDGRVKKQLEQRYNLSPQCGVYGIFSSIVVPGADHDTYTILQNYVKDHRDDLAHISNLLNARNKNISDLYEIIDKGIEAKERIIGSAMGESSGMGGMH